MKTKELIKRLQEVDPDGNCDVLIGNRDINKFMFKEPGYYDGRAQICEFDETGCPVKSKIICSGTKICLSSIDIADIYFDQLCDGREYPIETESTPGDWLSGDWLFKKIKWSYEALDYSINHNDGEHKEFIESVIEKLRLESIESMMVGYKSLSSWDKKRKVVKRIIEKLNEYKIPYFFEIYDNKDYITLESRNHKKLSIKIYKDKIVSYNWITKEETDFNPETYDWLGFKDKIESIYKREN